MHARRTSIALSWILVAACSASAQGASAEAAPGGAQRVRLQAEVQRDPLFVAAAHMTDPAADIERLVVSVAALLSGERGAAVTDLWDKFRGRSTAAPGGTFLAELGPDVVFALDLPPIDPLIASLGDIRQLPTALLGRSGLLASVRNPERAEAALRAALGFLGAEFSVEDGLVVARIPLGGATDDLSETKPNWLVLYYATRGDRLALGASAPWVVASLAGRPPGERLSDGADFARVAAHIDAAPTSLVYANLPKLRELVRGSRILQAALGDQLGFDGWKEQILSGELLGVGAGSSIVKLDDGSRAVTFGPSWLSGGALVGAVISAAAATGAPRDVEAPRVDQTVSHLEAIAAACEAFSADARVYPGPTEGWVPVERIAGFLEPVYIGALPRLDGWRNPILYWSDGVRFRVLSRGRDGALDPDRAAAGGVDTDIIVEGNRPSSAPLTR